MAWQHMHAVRELALSHIEKVILYALASRVDDGGECWPSLETLAQDTGLARRTLQYHLNTLIEAHIVTREERRGATTILRLHLCAPGASASGSPVQDSDGDMRDVHDPVHATDEMHAQRAPEVKRELPLNLQELPRAREISTSVQATARTAKSQNRRAERYPQPVQGTATTGMTQSHPGLQPPRGGRQRPVLTGKVESSTCHHDQASPTATTSVGCLKLSRRRAGPR